MKTIQAKAALVLAMLGAGLLILTPELVIAQSPALMISQANSAPVQAETLTEAEELNAKVIELHNQGQYATAIPLAKRALAIYEKVQGSEHLDVATNITWQSCTALREIIAEAEPLHQRALAIREKQLGSDHIDVAASLNRLAVL